MRHRLSVSLRRALSVGVVGGVVLGIHEGLSTLQANAYAQPGQYTWLYLTTPVLLWVILATALLLPCALLATSHRKAPALWLYVGIVAAAGAASVVLPSLNDAEARLIAVGFHTGVLLRATLWGFALSMIAGSAAILAAATAWYVGRTSRPLRIAAPAAGILTLLCIVPAAHFLITDWKWTRTTDVGAPAAAGEAPPVVLRSIETLRADHLGSYGAADNPTPHLDRLAREGVVFEEAITSSPWTLPAVASLLTGAYPRHHGAGAIDNRRDPLGRTALPSGVWTLADALRQRGYRTHAIVTNPYLALRYGLGHGFNGYENVTIESEAFLAFRDTAAVRIASALWPGLVVVPPNRPFFLWLHYVDPHPPYSRPGATTHKSFRGDSLLGTSGVAGLDFTLTSPDVARLRSGELRLGPDEKDAVRALYRAEVRAVDAAVGVVLDTLDALQLSERTLVICVADHGEEFWEHGGVEHGHTVYEEVVHIPLLLRWPTHLPAGQRVRALVRIVDVAPTVAELLTLPRPPHFDGASLVPLLDGHEALPREALVENLLFADERVGLRTHTHKYVHWDIGKEEVYDLVDDPGEQRDLAGVDTVLLPLRQRFARVDDAVPVASTTGTAPVLDATAIEALRALGYAHQ
jgi:arylsulfatase A-like enzyme